MSPSVDVDTGSYTNCANAGGWLPSQPDAVRAEEFLNYFDYGYEAEVRRSLWHALRNGSCPWKRGNELLMVGLQTQRRDLEELPASRLVFLVDTSGSMNANESLPMVKKSSDDPSLRPQDRVATWPTRKCWSCHPQLPGTDKETIVKAMKTFMLAVRPRARIGTGLQDRHGANGSGRKQPRDPCHRRGLCVGPSSEAELVR